MNKKTITYIALLALGVIPFSINAQTITSIFPVSVDQGSSQIMLTVNGRDFENGSKVLFNGREMPTTYQSANRLTAAIPALEIEDAGEFKVKVLNQNGDESNEMNFMVNETPGLPATGLGPEENQGPNMIVLAGLGLILLLPVGMIAATQAKRFLERRKS